MAEIKFYANTQGIAATGDPSLINHGAASGLGFYGAGFGVSVPVDQYQDSTFITNSAGTTEATHSVQARSSPRALEARLSLLGAA